ncbi:MAG: ribosome biogenesis GTP-binding protein YihA/YsxC [Candidatus Methylacidiphilales bacterium]
MDIKTAEFKMAASNLAGCPKGILPEFAFIGRSNVGKSSLINMLVERKDLARTSATPGKTVSINFFLINSKWHLVDLPGYGYAKRSKTLRSQWETVLIDYLKSRENLQCVFVLIDCRVPPQTSDISFINMLGKMEVPFVIVFTKLDKIKAIESAENIQKFKDTLLLDWSQLPACFETSSVKEIGRKEILTFISNVITPPKN